MASQQAAYLFVPGDRPERFPKALQAAPGMAIIDLEDAVAPQAKDAARAAVANWLTRDANIIIRINAEGTPWFEDDLRLVAAAGVQGAMLSKAESPATVARVGDVAGAVVPLIETALGMAQARLIARQRHVARLAFGSIDLKADLGIGGNVEELDYFRSELVLASRLAELDPPIDGVTTAIDDTDVLRAETLRARRFGFGAKLCIHPRQVAIVNGAFAPSAAEVAWARLVLDAIAGSDGAAVAVNGKMVDKPVAALAARIVAAA
ncbi:citrate lyase subunit beta / citryl-CoA lyase [Duganella sp. CF402]|uniref:HpcH/HpaI aldolase/citrate lyase family protein n=1 Tax=unclassified Duganella TaxID=2636909 RepID=UPI0008B12BA5|nr:MULTISPECIES: CoA ester lyase [unclassified Duganella]RZT08227.1 citrate lyase subunit beta/citryl-CoA lyase [Duganella sp. BK701]SEM01488.1 citrate lyase subunit beta / citryl-CoA lyase [Duganella sp. CF402]